MTFLWGVSAVALFGKGSWSALCGLLALVNLWRFGRSLVTSQDPVEVGPDGITVPLAFGRLARLAWSEVELVALHVGRAGQRLLLSTPARTLVLDSGRFDATETPQRIFEAVRAYIAALPDGYERLQRMQQGMADTQRIARRPVPATIGLLVVLAAVYLIQVSQGNHTVTWITMGANVPLLVAEGEWWRLVSANFLHANEAHIILNGFGLWILGGQLERLLGSRRLLGVYLLSAVGGAAASTLFTRAAFSLGASTAVFGVLGAMGALHLRRADLPLGFRQPWRWWAFILGINAALPLAIPIIDWMAHAGGFVAGAAATWWLVHGRPLRPGGDDLRSKVLLGLTAAVTAGGLAMAVTDAVAGDPTTRALRVAHAALPSDSEARNEIAWFVVIDPAAADSANAAAITVMTAAVEANPSRPDLRDTLATAYHRVGDWEQAVTHQRRAFGDLENYPVALGDVLEQAQARQQLHSQFGTQLARFYRAGEPPPMPDVLRLTDGGPAIGPGAPADGDHVVFATVEVGDDLAGLLRVRLTRADISGLAPHDFLRLPADATLRVVEVVPAGATKQPPNTWTWWKADKDTLAYP